MEPILDVIFTFLFDIFQCIPWITIIIMENIVFIILLYEFFYFHYLICHGKYLSYFYVRCGIEIVYNRACGAFGWGQSW